MSEYQEDPEETAAAELLAQDHDPRCPLLTVDTDILFAGRNYGIIDELCTCRDEDGHHRRPREDELDVDGEDERDAVDDDAADERAGDDERWHDRGWGD